MRDLAFDHDNALLDTYFIQHVSILNDSFLCVFCKNIESWLIIVMMKVFLICKICLQFAAAVMKFFTILIAKIVCFSYIRHPLFCGVYNFFVFLFFINQWFVAYLLRCGFFSSLLLCSFIDAR